MRIASVSAYLAKAEMIKPFRIAYDVITSAETVFVMIETRDGLVGWGEAPPAPKITGDAVGTIAAAVKHLAPRLEGLDPTEYWRVWHTLNKELRHNTAAKAGVMAAVLDIAGKAAGLPTYKLLGGWVTEFETDYTLSLDEPEVMAEEAREWVRKGFKVLKVKLGGPLSKDLKRVKAVRDAVGPSVRLRVDANQAWSLKEAIVLARELAGLGVEMIEQPLPARALRDLTVLREASPIPIVLDESVHDAADALECLMRGACDGVNIKLAKAGGILGGLEIGRVVRAAGAKLMIGCMNETKLGITASAHLVAALGGMDYVDLDADLFLKKEPVKGGIERDGGTIRIPNKPGLGVEVLEDELEKL